MSLDALIQTLRKRHFPYPPASRAALTRLKRWGMPDDLLRLYGEMDGACLHLVSDSAGWRPEGGACWKWVLLPVKEMKPIQEAGYMPTDSPLYKSSATWIRLVDVQDGDCLAINTTRGQEGEIIDCFHETVGNPGWNNIVAPDFTTMLRLLLRSSTPFWLRKSRRKHGAY